MTTETICSCGNPETHKVATRETADGFKVTIWSDGGLTVSYLHHYVRGLGNPRTNYGRTNRKRSVKLLMDSFGLMNLKEISRAIKLAERSYAHTYDTEDSRRLHVIRQLSS